MGKYNWSLEKIYKNVDEARAEIKLCDEFIEKLYVDPKDNKEMSKEEKEQLTKFVDGLLEQLDEER